MKIALVLLNRYRAGLYELCGAASLIFGLSRVSDVAAWLGVSACLLAKSLEADIARKSQ